MATGAVDDVDISASVAGKRGRYVVGSIGGTDHNGSGGNTATDTEGLSESGESREPVSQVARRRRTNKAADKQAIDGAADMLVGMIEGMGVMRYGLDRGRMQTVERNAISGGLKTSFASLPAEIAGEISKISGPVMVGFGLLLYGMRMANNEQSRRANAAESERINAVAAAQNIMGGTNGTQPTSPDGTGYEPQNLYQMRQQEPAGKDDLFDRMNGGS